MQWGCSVAHEVRKAPRVQSRAAPSPEVALHDARAPVPSDGLQKVAVVRIQALAIKPGGGHRKEAPEGTGGHAHGVAAVVHLESMAVREQASKVIEKVLMGEGVVLRTVVLPRSLESPGT